MMKFSKLITTLSLLLIGMMLAGTPAKAAASIDMGTGYFWASEFYRCQSMQRPGMNEQYEDCLAGMAKTMMDMGDTGICAIAFGSAFAAIWGSSSYLLLQRILATFGLGGGLVFCRDQYSDWFD